MLKALKKKKPVKKTKKPVRTKEIRGLVRATLVDKSLSVYRGY